MDVLDAGNGDEGTAMLEIVHDLAPKADLAFAPAGDTPQTFAASIRALRARGADVIVDDVTRPDEPVFQDGPVARAVAEVAEDGALYFSSAGNDGNVDSGTAGNYEGVFRSSGRAVGKFAGSAHDFDPGSGVQVVNPTTAGSAFAPAVLQWADPLGAAADDYDLYALDAAGNVVAYANTTQDGDDDPVESLSVPDLAGPVHLVVTKFSGADRYFQLGVWGGRFAADGPCKAYTSPGSVRGHSSVPAAFSVAAVPARVPQPSDLTPGDPPNPKGPYPSRYTGRQKMERFTSDGPRRVFFEPDGRPITPGDLTATGGAVRTDPDLAAADGVRTSLVQPDLDPFFGTSASAPHAAAIAALALSGRPGLTAAQFRDALRTTALDIEGTGADRNTGSGIIMAEPLLEALGATGQPYAVPGSVVVSSTTDGDRYLEPGERGVLSVPVTNTGDVAAAKVAASLRSSVPGVTITPSSRSYGTLAPGARATRTFTASVGRTVPAGTRVQLSTEVSFTGAFSPRARTTSLVVGQPSSTTKHVAYAGPPVPIPDGNPDGVSVRLRVSGVGPVSKATFSLDGSACSTREKSTTVGLQHSFPVDLAGTLTGPDGTRVRLFTGVGSDGNNFCKTVFADSATRSITAAEPGDAPFTGKWRPAQPLSAFRGKDGNGTWTFTVVDRNASDAGTLRKFSVHLNGYLKPRG